MAGKIIRGQLTDTTTGEFLNIAIFQPKTPHPYRKEGFIQMSQGALLELAKSDLTGEDLKVLFALLAQLDFENFVQAHQQDISEQTGIRQPNVARSIKHLCDHGVILKGPKVGRSNTYRLSPTFGFKGKSKNYGKMMSDINKFASGQRDPNTIDLINGVSDAEQA